MWGSLQRMLQTRHLCSKETVGALHSQKNTDRAISLKGSCNRWSCTLQAKAHEKNVPAAAARGRRKKKFILTPKYGVFTVRPRLGMKKKLYLSCLQRCSFLWVFLEIMFREGVRSSHRHITERSEERSASRSSLEHVQRELSHSEGASHLTLPVLQRCESFSHFFSAFMCKNVGRSILKQHPWHLTD